jgi:hypothetical protein
MHYVRVRTQNVAQSRDSAPASLIDTFFRVVTSNGQYTRYRYVFRQF